MTRTERKRRALVNRHRRQRLRKWLARARYVDRIRATDGNREDAAETIARHYRVSVHTARKWLAWVRTQGLRNIERDAAKGTLRIPHHHGSGTGEPERELHRRMLRDARRAHRLARETGHGPSAIQRMAPELGNITRVARLLRRPLAYWAARAGSPTRATHDARYDEHRRRRAQERRATNDALRRRAMTMLGRGQPIPEVLTALDIGISKLSKLLRASGTTPATVRDRALHEYARDLLHQGHTNVRDWVALSDGRLDSYARIRSRWERFEGETPTQTIRRYGWRLSRFRESQDGKKEPATPGEPSTGR